MLPTVSLFYGNGEWSLSTGRGMPDTISITSSARVAMYWFIQPCMSVNFRCSSFSEVPPIPISLVTKIKVASCAVKRSNSSLTAASARSVSEFRSKKKLVHHKVIQSIRITRPSNRCRLSSFSSSIFVHSDPRRSWCLATLWRNSSSQMRAVAR